MNTSNVMNSRRNVLKTTIFGALGFSMTNTVLAHAKIRKTGSNAFGTTEIPKHFPNIDPEIVSEVVGKSHSNLERVKELVDKRPELARSVWEWRFGDFESAIGAASHVGRRDIAQYLMSKGARPSIFTFAMMGAYETVKSMVEFSPGIQKTMGPHGISLLDHAYNGQRMSDKMTSKEVDNLKRTIDYLESLGDAAGEKYLDVSPEEQNKYLGDYKYGEGEDEGFTVQINMRKLLSLAPIGGFGGSMYKLADNKFTYNGAPSVIVTFDSENEKIKALNVHTPEVEIKAWKI